jgi:hypothetical protein
VWCNQGVNIWQRLNWGHEPCLDLRPWLDHRSAEDCDWVFASIHGSDTYDRASRTMP